MSDARHCDFPGCTTDISDKPKNARWCSPHRVQMECSRSIRRWARQQGTQFREPRVSRKPLRTDVARTPEPVSCRVCCDMPWARTPERFHTRSGDGVCRDYVVVNGLCKGCGEPYGPEPAIERPSVVRSSAGTAQDHGRYYGTEGALGTGTGRRKS